MPFVSEARFQFEKMQKWILRRASKMQKKLKMQKNANEKCKSTPNIKSLTKKCKSDMQIYRKKMQKPFTFKSQSLPNKFS